jgi:hypothetical protein
MVRTVAGVFRVVSARRRQFLAAGLATLAVAVTIERVTTLQSPAFVEDWMNVPAMSAERYQHTATLLTDGRVLVAGGHDMAYGSTSSVDIFNPVTHQWTAARPMWTPRSRHVAALLADGRVLVAGGENVAGCINEAEIYNPVTDTWTPVGSMAAARERPTAIPIAGGRVMVAGGSGCAGTVASVMASTEIFDPATNGWSWGPSLVRPRLNFEATQLAAATSPMHIDSPTSTTRRPAFGAAARCSPWAPMPKRWFAFPMAA